MELDLRFAFWPLKPQKLSFWKPMIWKVIFMHIWITGSPIPISFLTTTFFRFVGSVSQISCLSDQRFAFWHNKPQKLCFWKSKSWKSYFHSYLDNRDFYFDFISSYSFLLICGRSKSSFMAIGSTVCILTPQIKTTKFLKDFELKKLFSCISW